MKYKIRIVVKGLTFPLDIEFVEISLPIAMEKSDIVGYTIMDELERIASKGFWYEPDRIYYPAHRVGEITYKEIKEGNATGQMLV